MNLPRGLSHRLAMLFPDAEIIQVIPLRPDAGTGQARKGLGSGRPLRVRLKHHDGTTRSVVFHVEGADEHGHDRRADRAASVLLAWDSFPGLPHHARALDVGAITHDGRLLPLQEAGELYLITDWVEGDVYAADLRRIAQTGVVEPLDLQRVDALTDLMLEVHDAPGSHEQAYVRALRDLVGSGEGIAGIVDNYPPETAPALTLRLAAIEQQCLTWRQRLKHRTHRLRRTHGDFHPFNLVFAAGSDKATLLDTSRGSQGDPADDVTCLSINYLFFGLENRAAWRTGLGLLWTRFWDRYTQGGDGELFENTAPFFAWRALVLCNPRWYPQVREADRERLLQFAERVVAAPRFEPAWVTEVLR